MNSGAMMPRDFFVIRLLKNRRLDGVTLREMTGEGAALMQAWEGASEVILVDAIASEAPCGSIHRIDAQSKEFPPHFFSTHSTHQFGVAEAIHLARALGQFPESMIIYGIEGRNFDHGGGLTPEVETAVQKVVQCLLDDLG